MCGILSQVSPQAVDVEAFSQALDCLKTRGPDGSGLWLSPDRRVALGHRRLAIVDASGGQQPISDEENGIVAVVNGEFYDHALLRIRLQGLGYRFRSHSDSEVLIHLYRHYGLECLQFLRGEFAWILYDVGQRKLVAARDGYGIKPLLFRQQGEQLWLASKARAFVPLGWRPQWDEDSFFYASATQYPPYARTLFGQIQQLPPGHFLTFQDQLLKVQSYWDYPRFQGEEPAEPEEEFAQLLDECVRLRIPSQPVACQLSGGIDSAAVLALAAQASAQVTAFHVSFPGSPLDEREQAQSLAELSQVPLEVLSLTDQDLLESLQEATLASEGLAINAHLSAKYLLLRHISQAGFKVCLTGEGSDEVLLGYPHFRLDLQPSRAQELGESNQASRGIMLSQGPGLSLQALQTQLGHRPHFLQAKAALGLRLQSVMKRDFLGAHRERDCYQELLQGSPLEGRLPVEQSACLWNRSALAQYILNTLGDGCEMAHGVEGRLPFLDRHLSEFLARVPVDWKIRRGQEKYLLRQSMRELLPDWLLTKQKHPFMAPPLAGLSSHLREMAASLPHPFVDRQRLDQQLDQLDRHPDVEWQPALIWILTSYFLQGWLQ